ncbi:MAG: signal peptidase I [Propionibacteriales bacterium]|nr:signal peptidase I [Propionibacteriales bacterium]
MSPRVARALHRAGRVALSVTAVLGVVCALLTVLALVTGIRPLIFRSGSMGPDVTAGSLGFSRSTDAPDIRIGDVVTVTTKTDQKVTHRVVNVTHHVDTATLQLKGDANTTPDETLYQVTSAPRLLFAVPQAGYAVNWLSHAPGSYLLAGYVALMLVLIARRKDTGGSSGTPSGDRGPAVALTPARGYLRPPILAEGMTVAREPRGRGPRRALVAGVVVGLAAVGLTGFAQSTWAYWTDPADVSGTTITSGTWVVAPPVAPVITACASANGESGYTLTWTWSGTGNPDSFKLTYTNLVPSNTTVPPPTVFAGTARTGVSAPFNDVAGKINLVAVTGGVESTAKVASFAGKNNSKTCTF